MRESEGMMQPETDHQVILVIEDDPLVRVVLQDLFTEEGYTVMLAERGDKALITLETVLPDLITLDFNLPGVNGDVVLKELRNKEAAESLPVVLVSAEEALPPEVKAQVQAIVRKPFDVDDLLAVVHRLIPPPGPEPTG